MSRSTRLVVITAVDAKMLVYQILATEDYNQYNWF